eukprot:13544841-Heterocapsa_arctica.AAC.1
MSSTTTTTRPTMAHFHRRLRCCLPAFWRKARAAGARNGRARQARRRRGMYALRCMEVFIQNALPHGT